MTDYNTEPERTIIKSQAPLDAKIGVEVVASTGASTTKYFQMVGIDSGAPSYPTYTSWQVTDTPDITGALATPIFGGPVSDIAVLDQWIE